MRALHLSHGRMEPRPSEVQVRGIAQRLFDQRIELRVAVGKPPPLPWPGRLGPGKGFRAVELFNAFHRRRRFYVRKLRAAGARQETRRDQQLHCERAARGTEKAFDLGHLRISMYCTVRYSLHEVKCLSTPGYAHGA